MKLSLNARTAMVLYTTYLAIVFGLWIVFKVNYATVAEEANLPHSVLLPIGLGALTLALATTLAGAWRGVMTDAPVRRPGLLLLVLAPIGAMLALCAAQTHWGELRPSHLGLLVAGMLAVGFSEEMLTRGFMLAAFRRSFGSERRAWLLSSILFGLLHVPNGLFGAGWPALLQAVLAFCMGSALYSLRRLTGTLLVPMLAHAAWDFLVFAAGMTKAGMLGERLAITVLCYVVGIVAALRLSAAPGSVAAAAN